MKRHQVLTGAVNQGNHCFAVGGIASFTFWVCYILLQILNYSQYFLYLIEKIMLQAYGSGCDLVILGVDLKPIHIIPGNSQDNRLIVCIDCSQLCGKVSIIHCRNVPNDVTLRILTIVAHFPLLYLT